MFGLCARLRAEPGRAATTAALLSLLAVGAAAESTTCSDAGMRIAVIGATGGVGAHVVRLALEQGHSVLALARDTSKISGEPGKNLKKEKLDMKDRDADALATQLKGSDLVLSCIGNRRGEDPICLLYTSPSPRDRTRSRMPSSA